MMIADVVKNNIWVCCMVYLSNSIHHFEHLRDECFAFGSPICRKENGYFDFDSFFCFFSMVIPRISFPQRENDILVGESLGRRALHKSP